MKKTCKLLAVLLAALMLASCTPKKGTTDTPEKSEKPSASTGVTISNPTATVTPSGSNTPSVTETPTESGTPSASTTVPVVEKEVTLTEEQLLDKLDGGWIGQMVGVAWAASTEFCYAGQLMPTSAMPVWRSEMINDSFGQDDLYVEIPFLEAMRKNGVDCDPKYIADMFKDSSFALWHANYMGRENLKDGIL